MTADEKIDVLKRRSERIVSEDELRKRLAKAEAEGKQLRIKLGMDPTAPDVHLGHAVPLKIVRQFQDWGHKAVIIVGDYTARVGDPSGRNDLRPVLSGEEIDANAKTYVGQIGKVLRMDPEHLEVRYNSEWLSKMSMIDVIKLLGRKTVAQLLAREDFSKRYESQTDIYLHELFYPLLQGWDSVCIDADLEMGGNDQLFNNLVGRELQEKVGKQGQMVMVTPLLVGTDGSMKMSKSKRNYIGLTDPAGGSDGIFGKVMSLPDGVMAMYYTLLTDWPETEWRKSLTATPKDAKVRLAKHLIAWLHDEAAADKAEKDFMTATHGGIPEGIEERQLGGLRSLASILVEVGFVKSKSEAYRKLEEGAIRLDGQKQMSRHIGLWCGPGSMPPVGPGSSPIKDIHGSVVLEMVGIDKPTVLQMGSKRFVRLVQSKT